MRKQFRIQWQFYEIDVFVQQKFDKKKTLKIRGKCNKSRKLMG